MPLMSIAWALHDGGMESGTAQEARESA